MIDLCVLYVSKIIEKIASGVTIPPTFVGMTKIKSKIIEKYSKRPDHTARLRRNQEYKTKWNKLKIINITVKVHKKFKILTAQTQMIWILPKHD